MVIIDSTINPSKIYGIQSYPEIIDYISSYKKKITIRALKLNKSTFMMAHQ